MHDPLRNSLSSEQYEHIFSTRFFLFHSHLFLPFSYSLERFPCLRNAEILFRWLKCLSQGLLSFPVSLTSEILSFFAKKKVRFQEGMFLFVEDNGVSCPPSPSPSSSSSSLTSSSSSSSSYLPSSLPLFPSSPSPPSSSLLQHLAEERRHFFTVNSVFFDGKDKFTVSGTVNSKVLFHQSLFFLVSVFICTSSHFWGFGSCLKSEIMSTKLSEPDWLTPSIQPSSMLSFLALGLALSLSLSLSFSFSLSLFFFFVIIFFCFFILNVSFQEPRAIKVLVRMFVKLFGFSAF